MTKKELFKLAIVASFITAVVYCIECLGPRRA